MCVSCVKAEAPRTVVYCTHGTLEDAQLAYTEGGHLNSHNLTGGGVQTPCYFPKVTGGGVGRPPVTFRTPLFAKKEVKTRVAKLGTPSADASPVGRRP
jgi:hypothetical protein